jgi:hypothetical protein
MAQNTSPAVMAQRVEVHDSLDFFPTPGWATRALCEWLFTHGHISAFSYIAEPACGQGHMARVLREYFNEVFAADVHSYGFGETEDFLWPSDQCFGWIITNPPFRLGEQFALIALERAKNGCAFLVRTGFLESASRYENLFSKFPPSEILQFAERVPMFKGRVDEFGSTATAYCWTIWRKNSPNETQFHWIPPCRKRLERPGDYDAKGK